VHKSLAASKTLGAARTGSNLNFDRPRFPQLFARFNEHERNFSLRDKTHRILSF
jgi:hypothetical protein